MTETHARPGDDPLACAGRIGENVMHFARLLRAAGLRIGPDRVIDCVRSLELVNREQVRQLEAETGAARLREDWYWTMSATLLSRREQQPIFDQAFRIFWRDPEDMRRPLHAVSPGAKLDQEKSEPQSRRLTDAMQPQKQQEQTKEDEQKTELDARFSFSAREVLQNMDFDGMSGAELDAAKRMLAELRLPLPEIRTRRYKPHPRGTRVDLRASLRESLREGGDVIPLVRDAPGMLHPPLVVLCDISGSMNPYARMFLHFLHAITNDRDRVTVFVFGTRLTNITRQLRHRDVDVAMAKVAGAIADWSGGTRIGNCLREFNWRWGRRVLGQNACVLLVSDGLDREAGEGLGEEMARMQKSCRSIIWMNPLLRYERFEARPAGVRAMLPHVDLFLPVHNLKSLVDLARVLSNSSLRQGRDRQGFSMRKERRSWK